MHLVHARFCPTLRADAHTYDRSAEFENSCFKPRFWRKGWCWLAILDWLRLPSPIVEMVSERSAVAILRCMYNSYIWLGLSALHGRGMPGEVITVAAREVRAPGLTGLSTGSDLQRPRHPNTGQGFPTQVASGVTGNIRRTQRTAECRPTASPGLARLTHFYRPHRATLLADELHRPALAFDSHRRKSHNANVRACGKSICSSGCGWNMARRCAWRLILSLSLPLLGHGEVACVFP